MDVKKIFTILITVVVCVIVGAFVINILLPNAVNQGMGAIERGIRSATGLSFDLNGDGNTGANGTLANDGNYQASGAVQNANTAGAQGFNTLNGGAGGAGGAGGH